MNTTEKLSIKLNILQIIAGIFAIFIGVWWGQLADFVSTNANSKDLPIFWNTSIKISFFGGCVMVLFVYFVSMINFRQKDRVNWIYLLVSILCWAVAVLALELITSKLVTIVSIQDQFRSMGTKLLIAWCGLSLLVPAILDFMGYL